MHLRMKCWEQYKKDYRQENVGQIKHLGLLWEQDRQTLS